MKERKFHFIGQKNKEMLLKQTFENVDVFFPKEKLF